MNKILLLAAIVISTTFFSLTFASYQHDPLVKNSEQNLDFRFIHKIKDDSGYFAVIRKVSTGKFYKKSISKFCFEQHNKTSFSLTLVENSWERASGKSGRIFVDKYRELCPDSKNFNHEV
jgi:hypothetical protein